MKATINVEFTDDELRKYAEDVARRVGVNFIRDTVKTLSRAKISPNLGSVLEQALTGALGSKPQTDPGPTAGASPSLDRCLRIEANQNSDESWICCECDALNGVHRAACRLCGHGRCDIVIPPPPSPHETDPSVQ